MKTISLSLFLLVLTTFSWAQSVPAPAVTDFKSDLCQVCGMAVTNKSYAAQIVNDGKPLFFDDIGCLVQYERQGMISGSAIKARYVRSVAGDAWLLAEKAVWVVTKDVRTPMGYGLHAFADQKTADEFVKTHKNARVIGWKDAAATVPDKMGSM